VRSHVATPRSITVYRKMDGRRVDAGGTRGQRRRDGATDASSQRDCVRHRRFRYNAVYNTTTHKWSSAPKFPVIGGKQYDIADGPGAVLRDGDVLVDASPGVYQKPAHFFLFNGTTLTRVADTPTASESSSYYGSMVMLPTGQVLFNDGLGDLYVYNAGGFTRDELAAKGHQRADGCNCRCRLYGVRRPAGGSDPGRSVRR